MLAPEPTIGEHMIERIEAMGPPAVHPIDLGELAGQQGAKLPALAETEQILHAVKVQLRVAVGEIPMTVGELLAAHEGQVFRMDRGIEQPVDLILEGKVVARGQLVAVDGNFAIRISEVPRSPGA